MWGCGLKLLVTPSPSVNESSPPMWGCGLKSWGTSVFFVTPYVGVWIEITIPLPVLAGKTVTPYVGVWIEISSEHCI